MSESGCFTPESPRDFSLGIQMEEARKRMLRGVGDICEKMAVAEKICLEDVRRWETAFSMSKSFMEYDEDGEQADYLRSAEFDLDAYNRACEEIERAFADWGKMSDEEKDDYKEKRFATFCNAA